MELADFEKMEQIRDRVDTIVNDPNTAEALKPSTASSASARASTTSTSTRSTGRTSRSSTRRARVSKRITERGVVSIATTGIVEYERVDCIIYATGFEVGTD